MKTESSRQQITGLFEQAENLRDWPSRYFPALREAREALAGWRNEHPTEAAAEDAKRAAEKQAEEERREREYRDSFIGKGID